jgi:hypothetical protein
MDFLVVILLMEKASPPRQGECTRGGEDILVSRSTVVGMHRWKTVCHWRKKI